MSSKERNRMFFIYVDYGFEIENNFLFQIHNQQKQKKEKIVMSREFCPVEVFLEYISKEERLLQRLAHGESMQDIVREVQKCYKSKEGAKQATFRWLTREIRAVLERIFREEGELYSVPILETLKTRVKKSRGQRAKAWWYRRRKDSVFTVVIGDEYGKRGRYGAVRKFDAWKLERPGHQVWVEYPNGGTDWVTVS